MVEDIAVVLLEIGKVCRCVVENRLLVEVILDHFGYEIVDAFIISHTIAQGIHHGYVSFLIGLRKVRHAQQGGGLEDQGIHILIAHSAIDAADTLLFFP